MQSHVLYLKKRHPLQSSYVLYGPELFTFIITLLIEIRIFPENVHTMSLPSNHMYECIKARCLPPPPFYYFMSIRLNTPFIKSFRRLHIDNQVFFIIQLLAHNKLWHIHSYITPRRIRKRILRPNHLHFLWRFHTPMSVHPPRPSFHNLIRNRLPKMPPKSSPHPSFCSQHSSSSLSSFNLSSSFQCALFFGLTLLHHSLYFPYCIHSTNPVHSSRYMHLPVNSYSYYTPSQHTWLGFIPTASYFNMTIFKIIICRFSVQDLLRSLPKPRTGVG